MLHPPNFLRLYRKRSPLTQSDIAYLMGFTDYSNISRFEKGQREPGIELLLVYRLLFDVSIEELYEYRSEVVQIQLTKRIELLIQDLNKEGSLPKNVSRIKFLEQVLIRLTQ